MQQQVKSISYYENSKKSQHQNYISAHNNCVLCSTGLELQYLVDRANLEITEDAHCPACNVKARSKKHKLH